MLRGIEPPKGCFICLEDIYYHGANYQRGDRILMSQLDWPNFKDKVEPLSSEMQRLGRLPLLDLPEQEKNRYLKQGDERVKTIKEQKANEARVELLINSQPKLDDIYETPFIKYTDGDLEQFIEFYDTYYVKKRQRAITFDFSEYLNRKTLRNFTFQDDTPKSNPSEAITIHSNPFAKLTELKWNEVHINFTSKESFIIRARTVSKSFKYYEIPDFLDKKSKEPNILWELLFGVAELGYAEISENLKPPGIDKYKHLVSRGRQVLKRITAIEQGDPFVWDKDSRSYKLAFYLGNSHFGNL